MIFGFSVVYAQLSSIPPSGGNQKSIVRQYLGSVAFIEITYNSPDVAGREGKIWGQLVPYGLSNLQFGLSTYDNPSPWRAGANENTTIEFSHDMLLQGEKIPSGKYGFHVVPFENKPWEIILTNENEAWGSFFYTPEDEVLRVSATPQENEFYEYLTYEFTDRTNDSVMVNLKWEHMSVPIKVELDNPNEVTLSALQSELKSTPGFNHINFATAALWASGAGFHDQAEQWAESAVSLPFIGQKDFMTLSTKATVLRNANKNKEANEVMDEAIKMDNATAFQIHTYGRQLIASGNKEKAMEVFTYNFKRFDGSWPTHYGMARAYSARGDFKNALKHMEKAKDNVPEGDTLNQPVIEANIQKLKNKEDIN